MTDTPFNGSQHIGLTRNTTSEIVRARMAVASIAARHAEPVEAAAVVLQALGLIPYQETP